MSERDAPSPAPIVVVMAFDEGYVNCGLVAMTSAIAATPEPIHFIVIDCGITPAGRTRVQRAATPHTVDLHALDLTIWADLDLTGPHPSYARIVLDRAVDDSVTRLIYLDADTLVNTSLRDLFDTDLHGRIIGAAPDVLSSPMNCARAGWGIPHWEDHAIPAGMMYFNAGVLVVDVAAWRAARVEARVLQTLRDEPPGVDWDQGLLNRVLWRDWWPLDPRWNGRDLDDAIAHFKGPSKPWNPDYRATPVKLRYAGFAEAIGWTLPGASLIRQRTVVRRWAQQATPPGLKALRRR